MIKQARTEAGAEHLVVRLVKLYFSWQFLRFIIFGGSAAAVNLFSGVLLYGSHHNVLPYWAAVTVAALNGLLVNFSLNYFFNFRYRGRSMMGQLMTFCIVACVGIALTALLAVSIRDILELGRQTREIMNYLGVSSTFMAHFLSVGLVTFYSYAAHRYFTFNVGIRRQLHSLYPNRGDPLALGAKEFRQ
jgi:putative flippase GtrA